MLTLTSQQESQYNAAFLQKRNLLNQAQKMSH